MDRCPFPSLLICHVSQFWSPGRPTLRSCLVLHKERLIGMSSSGRVREGTWMWIVYSLGSEANTLTKFIYFVFLCFSLCVHVCGPSTLPELALNVFLIHSPLFLLSPVLSQNTELARPALRDFLSLPPECRDYKRSTRATWFYVVAGS